MFDVSQANHRVSFVQFCYVFDADLHVMSFSCLVAWDVLKRKRGP